KGESLAHEGAILGAVEAFNTLTAKGKATTEAEKKAKAAGKDDDIKKLVAQVRKSFAPDELNKYSAKPSKASPTEKQGDAPKKSPQDKATTTGSGPSNAQPSQSNGKSLTVADIQARLGQVIPRLSELGLTEDTIQEVMTILEELLTP